MAAASPSDVDRALWALQAYDTLALATVSEAGPHVAGAFFAPEPHQGGIRLLLALLKGSRKHSELLADPRVAILCSPGNPSRWIQGWGIAAGVEDAEEGRLMMRRLVEHAPGASMFVDRLPVVAVTIEVRALKVVEDIGRPPLVVELGPSREAA
jgi:hypothetical protein